MGNGVRTFEETYTLVRILKNNAFKFRITQSGCGDRGWFVIRNFLAILYGWENRGRKSIKLLRYDTRESPFHNISACPAHTLEKGPMELSWKEKGESNHFILKSKSTMLDLIKIRVPAAGNKIVNCSRIKTIFKIPSKYNGPPYLSRILYFAGRFGLVKVETNYQHKAQGKKDVAILKAVGGVDPFGPFGKVGSFWTYQWKCQFGPNKFNIFNTGQENKFKPPKPK